MGMATDNLYLDKAGSSLAQPRQPTHLENILDVAQEMFERALEIRDRNEDLLRRIRGEVPEASGPEEERKNYSSEGILNEITSKQGLLRERLIEIEHQQKELSNLL